MERRELSGFSMAACVALLAACATSDPTPVSMPDPVVPVPEEEPAPEQVESPAGPSDGIAFPELQGSWLSACQLFFEDEPEGGHQRTLFTVTGNDFVSDTTVYTDASCTTRLERGFMQTGDSFQLSGIISRPGGSANTAVGSAPNIDLDTKEITVDNQPLSPALEPFMPPEVNYNIVFVEDGVAMYLGEGGDSESERPTQLDLDKRYVKQ